MSRAMYIDQLKEKYKNQEDMLELVEVFERALEAHTRRHGELYSRFRHLQDAYQDHLLVSRVWRFRGAVLRFFQRLKYNMTPAEACRSCGGSGSLGGGSLGNVSCPSCDGSKIKPLFYKYRPSRPWGM